MKKLDKFLSDNVLTYEQKDIDQFAKIKKQIRKKEIPMNEMIIKLINNMGFLLEYSLLKYNKNDRLEKVNDNFTNEDIIEMYKEYFPK